ncbi:MAG TPA: DUF2269 family protein [Microbacteriaceae bacterium]|nr:DUF2269 family protein [Microbacteriaceae bacterium]
MELLPILHIATAVFIIGPMALLPHTGMAALRRGDVGSVRTVERSTTIFAFASLLVFMLGFGALGVAGSEEDWSFSSPWIIWSIVLYVVALGLTLFVVLPALRSGADAVEAGSSKTGYGALAASNGIVTLLLIGVVVLMSWKP